LKIDREQWLRLSSLLDAALDIDVNELTLRCRRPLLD